MAVFAHKLSFLIIYFEFFEISQSISNLLKFHKKQKNFVNTNKMASSSNVEVISQAEYNDLFGESDEESFLGFDSEDDLSSGDNTELEMDEAGEDGEDEVEADGEWTTKFTVVKPDEFSESTRPVLTDFDEDKAINYFEQFCGDNLLLFIVRETNRNAREKLSNSGHLEKWQDVTVQELRAYFGLVIVMGINSLPETSMYWSSDIFMEMKVLEKLCQGTGFKKLDVISIFQTLPRNQRRVRKGMINFTRYGKFWNIRKSYFNCGTSLEESGSR